LTTFIRFFRQPQPDYIFSLVESLLISNYYNCIKYMAIMKCYIGYLYDTTYPKKLNERGHTQAIKKVFFSCPPKSSALYYCCLRK